MKPKWNHEEEEESSKSLAFTHLIDSSFMLEI